MGDWQDLLREASRLRTLGEVDEAIAAYEKLLAARPDLAESWYNLGWLQRKARRFEEALASYQRALDLNVSGPEEVHLNRAVIMSDFLHRPEDAEKELNAALAKNATYVPALLNLGNLREDLGDKPGARDAYQRALTSESGNSLALARLTGVSHAPELDSALTQRLRIAIAGSQDPAEQADLGFALAGLLDAAAMYDEAFEAAKVANGASRASTGAAYDRAAHEAYVDRTIRTFNAQAENIGDAPAVFIVGMFRSGSTLAEQILGAHSKVTAGGELDLIPAIVSQIDGYPEAIANTDLEKFRDFYRAGAPPHAETILTDKRPDNFLHVGLIKALFPSAKIIHTRRNPLDNLLSLYFLHLNPGMAYALDLEDAAHWHAQYERLMAHWKALYPGDIFDVDYDALVRSPALEIRRLLAFLNLDWEDGLLDFYDAKSAVKTASVWQVRQPLHSRSSGRWKNYRRQLNSISEQFGEP